MTPNELRALADALEPLSSAPRFEGMNVPAFCEWLRACADAQPASDPCIGNDPNCPCQDGDPCHYRDHGDTKAMPIPQPQPVSDPRPCTCHPDDNPPVPCAQKYALSECRAVSGEPKRGLTCLWSRADDDTDVWETSCRHAFTIIEGGPTDNQMAFCCYCGRPVDEEIGGSDAE